MLYNINSQEKANLDMYKFETPISCQLTLRLIKSSIRIVAGITLCSGHLIPAGILLIVAELLGIAEELF